MLKSFTDGSFIYYGKGIFDNYCVFLKKNSKKTAPRDIDYFKDLKELSLKYHVKKLYNDFVKIYDKTTSELEEKILKDFIDEIASSYEGEDVLLINKTFSIIYLGMIAEENKKNTRLGKKIKRLGVYCLLIEKFSVDKAANFMRGKKAEEILQLCKERGF